MKATLYYNLETFDLFYFHFYVTLQHVLSVCGTWIYRLLPALHAHLPCTTLLNSEECALTEEHVHVECGIKFVAGHCSIMP